MGTAMWKGGIETSKMGRVKHVESPSVLDFIPRERSWGATEKVSAGESDDRSSKKSFQPSLRKTEGEKDCSQKTS